MAKREIPVEEMPALVGREVAVGDWIEIGQDRIDRFADTTEDRQWIHVDTARAAEESPFKTTIGHGFLSLSMLAKMSHDTVSVKGKFKMGINYGLNRVRFPAPVPAGSQLRGRFTVLAFDEHDWGVQTTWGVTVELKGSTKPCLVAEWLIRAYY